MDFTSLIRHILRAGHAVPIFLLATFILSSTVTDPWNFDLESGARSNSTQVSRNSSSPTNGTGADRSPIPSGIMDPTKEPSVEVCQYLNSTSQQSGLTSKANTCILRKVELGMCTTPEGQNQTLRTTVQFNKLALDRGPCLLWHEFTCAGFPFRIIRDTTIVNDLTISNTTNLGLGSWMCGYSLNGTFTSASSSHSRASSIAGDCTPKSSTVMATKTKIAYSMLPTMTIPWPPLVRTKVAASAANQSPVMMRIFPKDDIHVLQSLKTVIEIASPSAVTTVVSSIYRHNIIYVNPPEFGPFDPIGLGARHQVSFGAKCLISMFIICVLAAALTQRLNRPYVVRKAVAAYFCRERAVALQNLCLWWF